MNTLRLWLLSLMSEGMRQESLAVDPTPSLGQIILDLLFDHMTDSEQAELLSLARELRDREDAKRMEGG